MSTAFTVAYSPSTTEICAGELDPDTDRWVGTPVVVTESALRAVISKLWMEQSAGEITLPGGNILRLRVVEIPAPDTGPAKG